MSIKTIIYDPKILKGKEKSNHVLITAENAENAEELCPCSLCSAFSALSAVIGVLNNNSSLIQIQNLIYDKLWNRCTSILVLVTCRSERVRVVRTA
jgi:hypothetical protein